MPKMSADTQLRVMADYFAAHHGAPPSVVELYLEPTATEAWFTIRGAGTICHAVATMKSGEPFVAIEPDVLPPDEIAKQLGSMDKGS